MPERRRRILVVDDNLEMARTLADGLTDRGYEAVAAGSGSQALAQLAREPFDALVTDLRMPDVDGLELLSASRKLDPDRPVIVMTAYSAIDTAVESIRLGAYHYLTKPFKQEELAIFLERALEELRVRREASTLKTALRTRFSISNLIGQSAAIRAVRERVKRLADAPAPAIVLGETGTGKGIVARALHADSRRSDGPFVSVNCAALPESLLESELFGHVRGAFTGAVADRRGLFAEADGGSLFLDEIAEMTPALQAKLLHVLQDQSFSRLGSRSVIKVDVRILAATNIDIPQALAAKRLREDLYYRLNAFTMQIPPLRDRKEEIPILLKHSMSRMAERYARAPLPLSPALLQACQNHSWPGNLRELNNFLKRYLILGDEKLAVTELLPRNDGTGGVPGDTSARGTESGGLKSLARTAKDEAEAQAITQALERTNWNRKQAAGILQISYKALLYKIRQYGIAEQKGHHKLSAGA